MFATAYRAVLRRVRRKLSKRPQIMMVSFPKCGRTWLRMMLGEALTHAYGIQQADPLKIQNLRTFDPRIPHINVVHEDDPFNKRADELNWDKTRYRSSRIAFLVRDPRDVIVSAFFEKKKRKGVKARNPDGTYDEKAPWLPYPGTLEDFIDEPVGGIETLLAYYTIWYSQRDLFADFQLLRYEDLHANADAELTRLCDRFGLKAVGPESIRHAVAKASFENMRALETGAVLKTSKLLPYDASDPESFKTRKGVVGGYREYLSEQTIARLNERIQAVLPAEFGYTENAIARSNAA